MNFQQQEKIMINAARGMIGGGYEQQGRIEAQQAEAYAHMQRTKGVDDVKEPTVAEHILQQTYVLHKALSEIEARAEMIVGKLGYPVGNDATGTDKSPSRGGALGSIADSLDETGPRLLRILRHIETIGRQI